MNDARLAADVVGESSSEPKFFFSEPPPSIELADPTPDPMPSPIPAARSSSEYQKGLPLPPSAPVPMLGFFSVGLARESEVSELDILMLEETESREL